MEAIGICSKEDFDIIILDIMMPELERFFIGKIKDTHLRRGGMESIIYTKIVLNKALEKQIIMLNANITQRW
ncbi:hypothetical protein ACER0A_011720 [Haloimpatiens sp. FM7315]|uniref:hypothetical protein n=1 Tax=Haloimpatiens sp. FM7315 TaxID=3298609 RepID=UPI0035A3456E